MKGVAGTKLHKLYIADAVCVVDAVHAVCIVYAVVRCLCSGALLTQRNWAYARRVAYAQCVADARGAWLMHLRVADAALG